MRAWGSVLLVALAACSSKVTGTGGSSSSGGSGGTSSSGASSSGDVSSSSGSTGQHCMLVYARPACQSQLEASCCAPSATCRDDSDCFAMVGCIQTCAKGDTSCQSDCYSNHPNGISDFDSLDSCISQNLGLDCQFH